MKKIASLAGIAYERELGNALEDLLRSFEAWKRSEISAFDLEKRIHEFHQGPARRLYSVYTGLDPDRKVARAIALKVLKEDEVPKDVLEKLRSKIEFFAEL